MAHYSTQVVIIGAGPAGLALAIKLDQLGIENVILEKRTQKYVLARIRAGILEQTSVDILKSIGADTRLKEQGIPHHAVQLAFDNSLTSIGLGANTGGKIVTAYGQTEVTKDLCDLRAQSPNKTLYQAEDVRLHDFDSSAPSVTSHHAGKSCHIDCQIITGCDGYHGISRASVPKAAINIFEKSYPFGWLGLLADVAPVSAEIIYANADRGFALCSMRSWSHSRYYIQCKPDDDVKRWSDDMFWDEHSESRAWSFASHLLECSL